MSKQERPGRNIFIGNILKLFGACALVGLSVLFLLFANNLNQDYYEKTSTELDDGSKHVKQKIIPWYVDGIIGLNMMLLLLSGGTAIYLIGSTKTEKMILRKGK